MERQQLQNGSSSPARDQQYVAKPPLLVHCRVLEPVTFHSTIITPVELSLTHSCSASMVSRRAHSLSSLLLASTPASRSTFLKPDSDHGIAWFRKLQQLPVKEMPNSMIWLNSNFSMFPSELFFLSPLVHIVFFNRNTISPKHFQPL